MKKILFYSLLLVGTLAVAQNKSDFSISEMERNNNHIPDNQNSRKLNSPLRLNEFTASDVLSTPNPSIEAVALYRYIQDMFGKKIFSGQQWVQWGIDEIDYVKTNTGKKPAIFGFDYINESQNVVENQRAIAHWNDGGIVTMMWHQGAPSIGEGYDNSKMKINIDNVFIEGTAEYDDFWGDLERIGNYLQELEDAKVPVLWRPFHELTGNWFWWSKGGSEQFKKLWIAMHDYLVIDRKLDNLIWVLCYTAEPNGNWFPGNEYVDIAGADTYDKLTDSHLAMYNSVIDAIDGNNYPIAFHETQSPPSPQECIKDGAMWSWWMIWHTDLLTIIDKEYLKEIYNDDLVLTLNDIPNIVERYGWDSSCTPSQIIASIQLDNINELEGNKIGLNEASEIVSFKARTEDLGVWNWSGYGITDNADVTASIQDIELDGIGTTTAQFTNDCGAVTTQTFNVVKEYFINAPLAVNELSQQNLWSIYPSPAKNTLNINFKGTTKLNLMPFKIYNMRGELILQDFVQDRNHALDISILSPGLYSLVSMNDNKPLVFKFVKS